MRIRVLVLSLCGLCVSVNGCGKTEPITPTIDHSQKRKIYKVDVDKLIYPEGYPKQVKLFKPSKVYEQDIFKDIITWDTKASVTEARDHYVDEFKKLGFETLVQIPKEFSGENYVVQVRNEKGAIGFCVGVGCPEKGGSVTCYIFADDEMAGAVEKAEGNKKESSK